MKDVATAAGVSPSTVSNVLHDHPYVTAETRSRVEAAIERIGYRPSVAGRQLRGTRATVIALAVPDIRSPYFANLAHAVMTEARRRELTLFIEETDGSEERERQIALGYPSLDVDGVIFCPVTISLSELERAETGVPTVLLGEHVRGGSFDHLAIDSRASAIEATEHLIAQGRRRLAFMGACLPSGLGPANLRLDGVRAALHSHGEELNDDVTFTASPHTREEGYRVASSLLNRDGAVDGLICAADLQAVGALAAFRESGIEVPARIAVLAWDDSPEGRFTAPPLTSIRHDMDMIAKLSVEAVLRRQLDPTATSQSLVVPHELKARESTNTGP